MIKIGARFGNSPKFLSRGCVTVNCKLLCSEGFKRLAEEFVDSLLVLKDV